MLFFCLKAFETLLTYTCLKISVVIKSRYSLLLIITNICIFANLTHLKSGIIYWFTLCNVDMLISDADISEKPIDRLNFDGFEIISISR